MDTSPPSFDSPSPINIPQFYSCLYIYLLAREFMHSIISFACSSDSVATVMCTFSCYVEPAYIKIKVKKIKTKMKMLAGRDYRGMLVSGDKTT